MNLYIEDFIDFLNNSSKKYKLVDVFYEKYNLLLQKFPYLKTHNLVKEEFDNNLMELSGNLWKLIQDRKLESISELSDIKNEHFIEKNLENFGNYIINLIILETQQYYSKINLIKKFYYEFEKPKLSEKFPYEYIFKQESILEDINSYKIFIPKKDPKTSKEEESNEEYVISPKLDKIYKNCFKLKINYMKNIISLILTSFACQ